MVRIKTSKTGSYIFEKEVKIKKRKKKKNKPVIVKSDTEERLSQFKHDPRLNKELLKILDGEKNHHV